MTGKLPLGIFLCEIKHVRNGWLHLPQAWRAGGPPWLWPGIHVGSSGNSECAPNICFQKNTISPPRAGSGNQARERTSLASWNSSHTIRTATSCIPESWPQSVPMAVLGDKLCWFLETREKCVWISMRPVIRLGPKADLRKDRGCLVPLPMEAAPATCSTGQMADTLQPRYLEGRNHIYFSFSPVPWLDLVPRQRLPVPPPDAAHLLRPWKVGLRCPSPPPPWVLWPGTFRYVPVL